MSHVTGLRQCRRSIPASVVGDRPILIDDSSFGRYEPDRPWAAYRQSCERFPVTLALMSLRDPRLALLH